MNKFIIIGIGNYGKNFYKNRHNIGIYFINKLSKYFNTNLTYNKKVNGYITKIFINKYIVIFYIPNTFINNCGENIKNTLNYFNIKKEKTIIIHDDISFNVGISKLKFNCSDAGHNGIKNIIYNLNSKNFYRIRIGIGRPKIKEDINNYVLSNINDYEKKIINISIKKSILSIEKFINFNPIIAMNYLNNYKN